MGLKLGFGKPGIHPPVGNVNKRNSMQIKETKTGKQEKKKKKKKKKTSTQQWIDGLPIQKTSILSRWSQEAERVTPE